MSKKQSKEKHYFVKEEDVTEEKTLARHDIHVYLEKGQSFVLDADTKEEAESKVTNLWRSGRTEGLAINRDLLVAILVIPRYKAVLSFTKYEKY